MMIGRCWRFTPSSDMSARMPPSPSLSTRIATDTYLIVVTTIRVQITSDSTPRVTTESGSPPVRPSTVFSVYGDPQVEAAFAAVAREDFLGPGPWHIVRWGGGYRATPDADPIYLYTDDVIGILPKRNLNQRPALASCGADCRRRAPARGACPAYRRRRRLLHGNSRRAGRRHGEGDGDRMRCRARRPRDGEFGADAACPRGARRRHANRVRTGRRHLCQCRRDAARGCMARPPEGRGKADPAVDGGCISEPRCAAGSRVPDRAARPGIFGAPDLWGRDLSL